MLKDSEAFSSFSVDDIPEAKHFYGAVLGLAVEDGPMGLLVLRPKGGGTVMIYPKGAAHAPAGFTVLNFRVADIDAAVDALAAKGIGFEHYDTDDIRTDARGIMRGEPAIAWFRDPAGNILSVLQV